MIKSRIRGRRLPAVWIVAAAAVLVGIVLVWFTVRLNFQINETLNEYELEVEAEEKENHPTNRLVEVMAALREGDIAKVKNYGSVTELAYYTDGALRERLAEEYGDMMPVNVELLESSENESVVVFSTSTGEHKLSFVMDDEGTWQPSLNFITTTYTLTVPYDISVKMNGITLDPINAEVSNAYGEIAAGTDAGKVCLYTFSEMLTEPVYEIGLAEEAYTLTVDGRDAVVTVNPEQSEASAITASSITSMLAKYMCRELDGTETECTELCAAAFEFPNNKAYSYPRHTKVDYGEAVIKENTTYIGSAYRIYDVSVECTFINVKTDEATGEELSTDMGSSFFTAKLLLEDTDGVWRLVSVGSVAMSEVK